MDSSSVSRRRLGNCRVDAGSVPGKYLSVSTSGDSSGAAVGSFVAFTNAGGFHFVGILAYSVRP